MITLNDDHPIFDAVLEETGVDSRKTVFREKHHDGSDVQDRDAHEAWLDEFTKRANQAVVTDAEKLAEDLQADPLLGDTPKKKPTPAKAVKKAVPAQRTPEETK